MKAKFLFPYIMVGFIIFSCSSVKNNASDILYQGTWELEYITGPRIAFDGLFPNKKPRIAFDKENQKVQGNNSCNGYSADFTLDGNKISFGEPGPSTLMYCGEGEQVFLRTMEKVDNFEIDTDGELLLKMDDVAMMRFHKTEQKQN